MAIHPSVLMQFALFRHLSDADRTELAQGSTLAAYGRREVVLEKGAVPGSVGFVLEGRLQLVDFTLDGREVGLSFLDEGHYFGEVSMLDGLAHPEYVLANRKSQVVMVPARTLRSVVLGDSRLTEVILLSLAAKLRRQGAQRQVLSITNPLQRVCAQILLLAQKPEEPSGASGSTARPSATSGMCQIHPAPTHQELAIMLNLSRETVTRVFQVLQSRGALDRDGEALIVRLGSINELARRGE